MTCTSEKTANEYTVSYVCGTEENADKKQTVTYGQAYTEGMLDVADVCEEEGYSFGEFDCVLPAAGEDWDIADNVTCTSAKTANEYTVTLKLDGGDCSDGVCGECADTEDATCASREYIYRTYKVTDDDFNLPTSDKVTKTGSMFLGWKLSTENNSEWQNNNVADAETGYTIRTVEKGTSGNLVFEAQWVVTSCPEGYGHREEPAEGEEEDLTDLTKCYAIVDFDAQGGTTPDSVKIYYNPAEPITSYKLGSLPTSELEYNTFDGWYLVSNPGSTDQKVTTDTEFTKHNIGTEVTFDYTLYANWVRNTYTIVFDKNADDATGSKPDETCKYGDACTRIAYNNEITRTDYEFVGWATQPEATTAQYTDSITQSERLLPDDTLTLYAVWNPVCSTGKRLHIGDDTNMCLYAGKRTEPSLVIMIDGTKYYANMCKTATESEPGCDTSVAKGTNSKLHIMYEDKIYNVYDLTAQ